MEMFAQATLENETAGTQLGGGFNPIEKYSSNWIISLGRGKSKKYLKPAPRQCHGGSEGNLSFSIWWFF